MACGYRDDWALRFREDIMMMRPSALCSFDVSYVMGIPDRNLSGMIDMPIYRASECRASRTANPSA